MQEADREGGMRGWLWGCWGLEFSREWEDEEQRCC